MIRFLIFCVIAGAAACERTPADGSAAAGGVAGSGGSATGGGVVAIGGGSADGGGGSANGGGDSGAGASDGGGGSGGAAVNVLAVVNPSFEAPAIAAGTSDTDAPRDGWQPVGMLDFGFRTIGVLNATTGTTYQEPVPDGMNIGVVFLQDSLPASEEAGMEQTLSETLAVSCTYTLVVEVGNITSEPGGPYDFMGFPGYRIELRAGDTVIASDDGTLLPGEGRFETSTISVSIGDAHPNAGEPLAIRLMNLDGPSGIEVNFDDIRLSRTIP